MRRLAATAAATVALVLTAGCSADTNDFKHETERFLKSSYEVSQQVGTTFTKAECEAPTETGVGAAYQCVAVAADGATWDFAIVITDKNRFRIVDYKARA